ncbi:MAG: hypothetical protein HAW67_04395 [Endozoicomonadaceae bacterium]|nr:hypothetical protein [Endozoicomonadaceae bacterium]
MNQTDLASLGITEKNILRYLAGRKPRLPTKIVAMTKNGVGRTDEVIESALSFLILKGWVSQWSDRGYLITPQIRKHNDLMKAIGDHIQPEQIKKDSSSTKAVGAYAVNYTKKIETLSKLIQTFKDLSPELSLEIQAIKNDITMLHDLQSQA